MKKKQKISVIMSVYNNEKYLDQSILSILNQTFEDFEFIIINDASKDCSLAIMKKYQERDKRIKLVHNEKNLGLTKSLNRALKKAESNYIARQDADDISLPERLEKQYIFLEKNDDIFLCGTDRVNIDEKEVALKKKSTIITGCEKIEDILQKRNCITHSSIMFRNHGYLYREKFLYAQDYDFFLNLLSNRLKLDNLEDKLIKYRNVSTNISVSKKNKQEVFAETAKEFYEQRLKTENDQYDEFDPSKIIRMEDNDPKRNFLILRMKLHLEDRDFNNAKKVLEKYKKLEGVSFIDSFPYSICINMPYVYKLYRRIYYGDKSK